MLPQKNITLINYKLTIYKLLCQKKDIIVKYFLIYVLYVYLQEKTFERHVDLLLLSNTENSHYLLIKDFNRFMLYKTKCHGKKHFYRYSLYCFSNSRILKSHKENCLPINHTILVLLPREVTYNKFHDFKNLLKAPSVMNVDFECVLVTSTDNSYNGPNTEKYQVHIICSYGFKLKCVGKQYSKP